MKLEISNINQLKALTMYYKSLPSNSELNHLRLGQFIYNVSDLEVSNSYNEVDDKKAYSLLYMHLSNKKDN